MEAKFKAMPIYEPLECGTNEVTPNSVEVTDDEQQNTFDFNLGDDPPPKRAAPFRAPGGRPRPAQRGR
jgi:hypothetical protein